MRVGLVVIVNPGKPTQEMENMVREHPEERCEWVAADASSFHVGNVRKVIADSVTTAYAIGWLAANVAVAHNAYGPHCRLAQVRNEQRGKCGQTVCARRCICGRLGCKYRADADTVVPFPATNQVSRRGHCGSPVLRQRSVRASDVTCHSLFAVSITERFRSRCPTRVSWSGCGAERRFGLCNGMTAL